MLFVNRGTAMLSTWHPHSSLSRFSVSSGLGLDWDFPWTSIGVNYRDLGPTFHLSHWLLLLCYIMCLFVSSFLFLCFTMLVCSIINTIYFTSCFDLCYIMYVSVLISSLYLCYIRAVVSGSLYWAQGSACLSVSAVTQLVTHASQDITVQKITV